MDIYFKLAKRIKVYFCEKTFSKIKWQSIVLKNLTFLKQRSISCIDSIWNKAKSHNSSCDWHTRSFFPPSSESLNMFATRRKKSTHKYFSLRESMCVLTRCGDRASILVSQQHIHGWGMRPGEKKILWKSDEKKKYTFRLPCNSIRWGKQFSIVEVIHRHAKNQCVCVCELYGGGKEECFFRNYKTGRSGLWP